MAFFFIFIILRFHWHFASIDASQPLLSIRRRQKFSYFLYFRFRWPLHVAAERHYLLSPHYIHYLLFLSLGIFDDYCHCVIIVIHISPLAVNNIFSINNDISITAFLLRYLSFHYLYQCYFFMFNMLVTTHTIYCHCIYYAIDAIVLMILLFIVLLEFSALL